MGPLIGPEHFAFIVIPAYGTHNNRWHFTFITIPTYGFQGRHYHFTFATIPAYGSHNDQQVQLQNLMPLLRSVNIEGFMKNNILFQWPWRCTTHLGVIWIISSGSVLVFFIIDDQEVIYPSLFAFNFLGSVLVLLSNVL